MAVTQNEKDRMERLVREVDQDLGLQRTPGFVRIDSPGRSADPRNLNASHERVWKILYSDNNAVTVTIGANDSDQIIKDKVKQAITA